MVETKQGRWNILSCFSAYRYGKKRKIYSCLCDCGINKEVDADSIRDGRSLSCGCLRKDLMTVHGFSYTKEARIYFGLIQRCYNAKREDFQFYGAKGIKVSDDWLKGIEYFIEDMGMMPTPEHTLERVNHRGNYTKDNCIWTDNLSLQNFNQGIKVTNTSGRTGVFYTKGAWQVNIGVKSKNIYLGRFQDYAAAVKAREQAEILYYGFSKN